MNEVTIPLKLGGLAAMKAELRDLKDQLATATDPAQINALSQAAGQLANQIANANQQVNAFASGSKFTQIGDQFNSIGASIQNLDFAQAQQQATTFASTLGSLNPGDISSAFKGLIGTVGQLGKAFIGLGSTMLANPIFLMVAVVAAVVLAFTLWEDKLGKFGTVLKVVFINIYLLVEAVKFLIEGFKELTDWLGLTAFAAEAHAAKTKKAMEEGEVAIKRKTNVQTEALDRQISIDKASGKSTLKLEQYKANLIIKAAQDNLRLKSEALAAQLALGKKGDKKEIEALKEKIAAERKIILDQSAFKKVAIINDAKEKKESIQKESKIREPKPTKEPRQKDTGLEDAKKAAAEAAEYLLTLTMTTSEKEKYEVNKKYAALIESAKKYKLDTKDLEIAQMSALNQIGLKDQEAQKIADEAKKKAAAEKAAAEIAIEDAKYNELQRLTAANEQDKIKQVQLFAEYEKMIAMQAYDEKTKDLKEGDALLIAETTALQLQLAQITEDAKKKELAITKEIEEKKRAEIKKTTDTAIDFAEKSISAITAINDISMNAKLAKVKKGSKEEEALLRKQFTINKKLQLASAVIDASKAITASLASSPIAIGPVPNPAGIASLAFASITAATNIAKIAATSFESPGSPAAVDGAGFTAVAPSGPQLFGQANTGNNITAGGGSTNMTVTAVVSETEITATQHHINNIQNNSKL